MDWHLSSHDIKGNKRAAVLCVCGGGCWLAGYASSEGNNCLKKKWQQKRTQAHREKVIIGLSADAFYDSETFEWKWVGRH